MTTVLALDGADLVNDLKKAEQSFPKLVAAIKYLSIQAAASAVGGHQPRRGNILTDSGPAIAQLVITAANSVVKNDELANRLAGSFNTQMLHAAMNEAIETGKYAEPKLMKL
ncbi:hypothetical protein ABIC65_002554 [Sphingomonas trueperi]|uniref:hypothetical protein n=1 Tax=Sphingomonas trueperi TaxID=53317 RepID=UPI003392405C